MKTFLARRGIRIEERAYKQGGILSWQRGTSQKLGTTWLQFRCGRRGVRFTWENRHEVIQYGEWTLIPTPRRRRIPMRLFTRRDA